MTLLNTIYSATIPVTYRFYSATILSHDSTLQQSLSIGISLSNCLFMLRLLCNNSQTISATIPVHRDLTQQLFLYVTITLQQFPDYLCNNPCPSGFHSATVSLRYYYSATIHLRDSTLRQFSVYLSNSLPLRLHCLSIPVYLVSLFPHSIHHTGYLSCRGGCRLDDLLLTSPDSTSYPPSRGGKRIRSPGCTTFHGQEGSPGNRWCLSLQLAFLDPLPWGLWALSWRQGAAMCPWAGFSRLHRLGWPSRHQTIADIHNRPLL